MNVKILIYGLFFMIFAVSCNKQIDEPETLTQPAGQLKAGAIGDYYVATNGNDSNPGTLALPFLTIQKAANVAVAGDVVIVRDGTYTSSSSPLVTLSHSGTASNYITFQAENKWGAVLSGNNNSIDNSFYFDNASYIKIVDFEFKEFAFWNIHIYTPSNHVEITGNNIHHIGRLCSDTSYGFVGVYCDQSSDVIVEKNTIHDIGRFATGESGCTNAGNNFKNHDHGVYINGAKNITVRNNIFYNIKSGQSVHIYSGAGYTASNITIVNNTMAYGNPFYNAGFIMLYGHLSTALIANNIFYDMVGAGIEINQLSYTYSNVTIAKNMAYGGTGAVSSGSATGVTVSGSINSTNPLFKNGAAYDFSLTSTSPDINAGYATGLTTDYLGNTRSVIDIGAYEYNGAAPTPVATPVVTPVATPVVTPVATPVVTPVATPVVVPAVVATPVEVVPPKTTQWKPYQWRRYQWRS